MPPSLIYTLSLHDALPILICVGLGLLGFSTVYSMVLVAVFVMGLGAGILDMVLSPIIAALRPDSRATALNWRSEEHTSELQSHSDLVCRLLLEKKKKISEIIGGGRHEVWLGKSSGGKSF